MGDTPWIWQTFILMALGVIAWLIKSSVQTLSARIDKLDRELAAHILEDRTRFDVILSTLGEMKGKLDALVTLVTRLDEATK